MNTGEVTAYLTRCAYEGESRQDEETLNRLIRAHLEHVPFENLDVFDRDLVPKLDTDTLFNKIVVKKRGGYCFEMNTLFGELLKGLGFSVYPIAARILWNKTELPPLSHMLLICELSGKKYCCDVGYGGPGPKGLVLLEEGEQVIAGERFLTSRVNREAVQAGAAEQGAFQISRQHHGEWKTVLMFKDVPFMRQDFRLLNFYCAKNPEIMFTQKRVVNLCTKTGSKALMDMELTVRDGETVKKEIYQSQEELERGLREEFGIVIDGLPVTPRAKEQIGNNRGRL